MRITAAWGYVHGLAILLIDQRLRGIIKVTPDFEAQIDLVDQALRDVRFGFEAGETGESGEPAKPVKPEKAGKAAPG